MSELDSDAIDKVMCISYKISRMVSSKLFCSAVMRSRSWMYLDLLVMSTQPRECEGLVP